jgi:subtilisin family serine protease
VYDPSPQAANAVPGEVILKLKSSSPSLGARRSDILGAASRLVTRVCGENSTERIRALSNQPGNEAIRAIAASHGIDRTFVVKLSPDQEVDWAIARLEASGEVEYAEPNRLVKLGGLRPNDPDFQWQWGLLNWGYPIDGFDPTTGADIHAEEAWAITTGSSNVIVAVADTGVDIEHPDLAANIYTNPGEIAGNGIDDDHNGYIDDVHGFNVADHNSDVSDVVGHGTEIAGIIAGVLNNQIGISGISQCKIMPVKFFQKIGPEPSDVEGTVADAAAAIVYAVTAGANIINASWTTLLVPGDVSPDASRALKDACAMARDADVLMVCIAGNDGYNLDYSPVYPGAYEMANQIVVAASDYNDQIWHIQGSPYEIRTGFGPSTVHLAAPGVSITTTEARGSCALCSSSTNPDDWYTSMDGSSASAAFVSGVAALVKSRYPEANGPVLRQRVVAGVDVLDSLKSYVISSGRLNAYGALTAQLSVTPPTLKKAKYKAGIETLTIQGQGIIRGAFAVVGGVMYPMTQTDSELTRLIAKVPLAAFPSGVSVPVTILNPDGGVSQEFDITR